ncbi:SusC/RagA family TonB-linked outer membrane protein [Chitinophaga tropicalis]|uniref:SusC/RagA family TonB-linked outer membrane protein n=1 Tax=Chitinophaga tropicalis TaxID=2683588 RepID=A0A7K1U2L7_9BACT|nr:TonB-dependent receptor [Chitinophaga tropicalis]MVT08588.1 SusC/RagA family TonB-linked outer membrane protein [Chitinophaga tropicalis]
MKKLTRTFRRRLTVILFLLLGASLILPAYAGKGQILKEISVTINLKSGSLEEAIQALHQSTKVIFAYDKQLLRSFPVQNCSFSNERLDVVLQKLLQYKQLSFAEVNNVVVISRQTNGSQQTALTTVREDMVVSGIVLDEAGNPMPGVSVAVRGMSTMTVTDDAGHFKLIVQSQQAVLAFSFIGYETIEMPVGTQSSLNIRMRPASKSLGEVAVVGFGTQRKVSLVGAQTAIKPAEFKQPAADITTMLAGRIAGIVGVQRSGEPGKGAADIWIRGISTFGDGNSASPLILVDGVERSINNISPEDIESFTVLKDAAGTAVYGVRGANGVILLKTKSGKVGKPQVYFDYNEGVNTFVRRPELLDGVTYMNLVNEALTTRNQNPKYTQEYIENTKNGTDPLLYPNVDWMDAVFNKYGHTRSANLNASGGVENAQYYVSLGYFNETGFLKTDDLAKYNSSLKYNRYNFTSNLNLRVTKTTKLDVGLQGYFSNGNYPGIKTGDIFQSAMDAAPVAYPIMYPGGFVPGQSSNGGFRNPYADLTRRGYRNEFRNQLYSNLRGTQDLDALTKGLKASVMFAFDTYTQNYITRSKREDTYFPDQSKPYNDDGTLNLVKTFTGNDYLGFDNNANQREISRKFYTEASLNYDRSFGKHRVGGLALFYSSDKTNALAGDFISSIPERSLGYAGRATYSYTDRYFVELNFGYNGSELFAPGHRFGFFPAAGIGWIVSEEPFFAPLKNAINFLKLRYSNGNTGLGSANERFLYITNLSTYDHAYKFGAGFTDLQGINISRYATDVRWSKSNKQDLGIEFRTLNDKLSVILDLFKEHRTGIFLQRASNVDFMGLQNQQYANLGIVDNKGFDATLEYSTRIGSVDVAVRGNITYTKDRLIEDDRPPQNYPWMEHRGNNVRAIYGYVADGLFASDDEISKSAVPGDRSQVKPGDIKYRDLNNDGLINSNDITRIGRGDIPSTVYGFGLNLGYKGFNIGVLFQGASDFDRHLGGSAIIPFNGGGGLTNAYSIATDRWTEENPSQDVFYPRLAYGEAENKNNTQQSSWWIKDMSFLRLKSAQLSYNLPSTFLNRAGIRNAAIYLQGINLFTFSKFKLWDPELATNNGSAYPNIRTVSLGMNLKF